ncbi:carboxymuconolactone decarboxylase family protein [Arthrobacter sp. TMN-37]
MPRMPLIQLEEATAVQEALLTQVRNALGVVPNMTKAMVNSTAALKGYLALSRAVAGGALGANTRERMALALAQTNECDYCLSAHTLMGPAAGLSAEDIRDARKASAVDAKTDALLKFAVTAVETRGEFTTGQIEDLRAVGVTDEEIAETVAVIALNTMTNFFNKIAGTEIEFPVVKASEL